MDEFIKRKLIISFLTLFVLTIIYLFPTSYKYDTTVTIKEPTLNTVYLLNNNFLVETTIISNDNINILDKVKDIIDTLTINGSKAKYINEDYSPLIPENTKVLDISLDNNLLKINFSKDFLNVNSNTEEKVIESIVSSLLKIDDIKEIMIFIEGEKLDRLPISKKVLPITLDKSYGINKVYDITDVFDMDMYTLYYYVNINNEYHIVPVSMFSKTSEDKVSIIIEELKSAPIYQSNLMSFLNSNVSILDYEIKENTIKIEFSNYLLDSFFNEDLIEEVKYAVKLSLQDSLNVENVYLYIDGKEI